MFVDIETFLLNTLTNAQTVYLLDTIEEDETTGSSPEVDDEDTKQLSTKETPAEAVEGTVARREQTSHQCAEDTTDTMYRAGTHRVVDVQLVIDELDGVHQDDTTGQTNDNSTHR